MTEVYDISMKNPGDALNAVFNADPDNALWFHVWRCHESETVEHVAGRIAKADALAIGQALIDEANKLPDPFPFKDGDIVVVLVARGGSRVGDHRIVRDGEVRFPPGHPQVGQKTGGQPHEYKKIGVLCD